MIKWLSVLLLIPITAFSDIKVQNDVGNDVTALYVPNAFTNADFVYDSVAWGYSNSNPILTYSYGCDKKDTTTHYIDRYDTILTLYEIECDTAWHSFERNDSTFIEDMIINCDSIYIEKIEPVWVKKKAPLLTKEQIEKLMKLLVE